ncbi:MAG: TOMM system kinase/cyclase fusion protein [Desulfatitalea sp.]|nr:TOMM system kinase/cyclase fusion protein [Desulfatitalea sp.]NNK01935.1 TOMM system kinase/cyclase fusion protein [Desulfatitalea sp.]
MKDTELDRITPCGYELFEKLGRGGFGTVFRARQQSTGQNVAVKILNLENIDEQERRRKIERFERETRLCADLQHPNIVRVIDKCKIDDHHLFMVFEYVHGETLRDLLLREAPLPALTAGDLMGQVLDGIACAHERGVVHRDLKPANIMIATTGARQHVKILDFGIGTFVPDARKEDYMSLTLSRETVGTPSYSAPEQLRGEPPTVKSDVYAWGLLLVECLTGLAVMQGSTMAEIFHRQLCPDEVPLPHAILGHPLGDLLRRVLQKNHQDRPGRTDQLYADFEKINLTSIVGRLQRSPGNAAAYTGSTDTTETVSPWPMFQIERRQITVLSLSLGLMPVRETTEPEMEAIDALQDDLIRFCADTGGRYGGYSAGALGDYTMMLFGYPQAGDSDARLAARTALEIAGQMRRRSTLLAERQGIRPALRIGIHSGLVTTCKGATPSGMTLNTAVKLTNLAPPGTVLVSDGTHRLLERHIHFESFEPCLLDRLNPSPTFLLIGERQDEAFSFLQAGPADVPMVGRDTELQTLRSQWAKALKHHGNAVLLRGEPGIGKSRLTYEIRRQITDNGHVSIVCRCLPEHRNNALFHVLEMIKSQLRLDPVSSPKDTARRLETALKTCSHNIEWSMPILCSWLSMPIPEAFPHVPHSPEQQKKILLEILEELILSMARDAPLLIILEDLHWTDQVTLELIDLLMARIPETQIMLLLTARLEFSVAWDVEKVMTIGLERISPEHAEVMIRNLTGDQPVHFSVLDAMYRRTDGVPLFIEELVLLMLDARQLVKRDGVYHIDDRFDPASIPITLQDLLNEKLGRLGTAQETAQTAAVIGREFDHALLVRVSLRDEPTVQNDLDRMSTEGLVYCQRRVEGETYIFRHALIRDAAYSSMVQSVKSRIHGRIAASLENDFPDLAKIDPGGIALHFAAAGKYTKAVFYGTQAAGIALGRSLVDEAIFHAQRVLTWIGKLAPEKQFDAELSANGILTQALMAKYGWTSSEVKAGIDRSRILLEHMEQNVFLFPALWALGTYHHVASNRSEVRSINDRLVKIAKSADDPGLGTAVDTLMGHASYIDGNYTQAARFLEQAIQRYDPSTHKDHGLTFGMDTRVWALSGLANVCLFAGKTRKALECGKQAIEWACKINHIPSIGIALLYRGMICHFENDKKGAEEICGRLIAESKKYGLTAYEAYGAVIHAWAIGDAPTLHRILKTLRNMGCMLGLTQYDSLSADLAAENGQPDLAVSCIDECISLCREIKEHYYDPELYRRRADYLLQIYPHGNTDIRSSLMKAVTLARCQGMYRTEAVSIQTLLRHFKEDGNMKSRLKDIIVLVPEVSEVLRADLLRSQDRIDSCNRV